MAPKNPSFENYVPPPCPQLELCNKRNTENTEGGGRDKTGRWGIELPSAASVRAQTYIAQLGGGGGR